METLPVEIIEQIICCKNLSISDVVNFSLTNRYNNFVVRNCNSIWKKEYFKNWPQFVKLFDNKFNNCWYAEVQYIYDLKRRTREILSAMSSRFFKKGSTLSDSDFTEWFELYQEKPETYYYLIDDLINIVNTDVPIHSIKVVPIITPGNKTLQYYAMKVLRYLRQLHLTKEWETYIALPQKLQMLEKGIVFVGQWFQPNSVSWNNFATRLDEFAEKVKGNLRITHPNHPLFDVPKEQLEMWRNENIECDKFDFSQCMQIKRVVSSVIRAQFGRSYFCAFTLLDDVIAYGMSVHAILLIVYVAVGRRLGVKYEPIIINKRALYLRSPGQNSFAVATMQQVVEVIAIQVVENQLSLLPNSNTVERLYYCWKFLYLVSTSDDVIRHCLLYNSTNARLYKRVEYLLQQKSYARDLMESIINMQQLYETDRNNGGRLFPKVESKVRPTSLKYAVGMVMNCPSATYSVQLCVICDWDCSASDEEPVYNVIFPDGTDRYVAQGRLIILPRIRSSSEFLDWCFKDIGLHFSHRFEAVFVPNAEKEGEYPEDTAVRNMYNDQVKPLV